MHIQSNEISEWGIPIHKGDRMEWWLSEQLKNVVMLALFQAIFHEYTANQIVPLPLTMKQDKGNLLSYRLILL